MQTFGSQPTVLLDGNVLAEDVASRLTRTMVETDLLAPSVCRLAFSDGTLTTLDVTLGQGKATSRLWWRQAARGRTNQEQQDACM